MSRYLYIMSWDWYRVLAATRLVTCTKFKTSEIECLIDTQIEIILTDFISNYAGSLLQIRFEHTVLESDYT